MKKYLFITILSLILSGCQGGQVPAETVPDLSLNTVTTTEEIDTSDWLTYKNEEYGFEFKYPKEWNINFENYTNINSLFNLNLVYLGPTQITDTEIYDGARLTINLLSLKEYNIEFYINSFDAGLDFRDEEFYGHKSSVYSGKLKYGDIVIDNSKRKIIYISDEKYIYRLETVSFGDNGNQYDQIINYILAGIP